MKRKIAIALTAWGAALLMGASPAGAQTLGALESSVSTVGSRTRETSGGNLVADAIRAAMNADAAIVAANALAEDTLPAGNVSRADLRTLLMDPEETVSVLELTGAQLRVVLQRSVSAQPRAFDGFLQVSGITLIFSAKPAADRLLEVNVNGAALDANRAYKVATLSTLAGGALGYFRLWTNRDVTGGGPNALDALADYAKARRSLNPRVEGRIKSR